MKFNKMTDAIVYIKNLIKEGKKVCIFSCEDPYNTPFHRDLFKLAQELGTDYLHLVTKAGGVVGLASIDLGLQSKGINAFGVFGHFGNVHGHDVCAAIKALGYEHSSYGHDLKEHIKNLSEQYKYDSKKPLKDNIINWIKNQYKFMLDIIPKKQKMLKGAVQDAVVIFCGLVENSNDAKDYNAKIIFTNL